MSSRTKQSYGVVGEVSQSSQDCPKHAPGTHTSVVDVVVVAVVDVCVTLSLIVVGPIGVVVLVGSTS